MSTYRTFLKEISEWTQTGRIGGVEFSKAAIKDHIDAILEFGESGNGGGKASSNISAEPAEILVRRAHMREAAKAVTATSDSVFRLGADAKKRLARKIANL